MASASCNMTVTELEMKLMVPHRKLAVSYTHLLALCLVLALTLPVFAEGESSADTTDKETYHIGTMDELLQLADYCRLDSWSAVSYTHLEAVA